METEDKYLEIIKRTVASYLSDAEVRLFGSRARSDAKNDSDYDILVISTEELDIKEKILLKTSIRKDLLHYDIRCDVLIQSRKDIEIKKELPGHIIRSILKEAIPI